jgi:cobalt-zinc-cadmium efflux system membrane fusion protein
MNRLIATAVVAVAVLTMGRPVVWAEARSDDREAAPGDVASHDEHADHEDEHGGREIPRHGLDLEALGIEITTAAAVLLRRSISLPGEVVPDAERMAHIVPRYAGIVTSVRARLGDRVERGQTLASVEADESLATFEVRTLIPGTVIAKHVVLGEAVSREQEIFVIADLSSVWVDLAVYQRDLQSVAIGQSVNISAGGEQTGTHGVIDYVSPVIDEATRTASARVVLANRDGRWLPGLFVTGEVEVMTTEVQLGVSRSALFRLEGEDVMFVATTDGFAVREVETGRRDREFVEIVSGLETGERYVSRGGFTLLSELRKSDFSGGHSH